MHDGVRYNHILDARTGRPTDPCQSVTTIGPHAGVANALSAAVFILGPDEGLAMLAAHYPDYAALIVDAQGRIRMSPNLAAKAKVVEIE
jgi:thiamine biosynthesis lipoprotein